MYVYMHIYMYVKWDIYIYIDLACDGDIVRCVSSGRNLIVYKWMEWGGSHHFK